MIHHKSGVLGDEKRSFYRDTPAAPEDAGLAAVERRDHSQEDGQHGCSRSSGRLACPHACLKNLILSIELFDPFDRFSQ
jgi:hypothetical protein